MQCVGRLQEDNNALKRFLEQQMGARSTQITDASSQTRNLPNRLVQTQLTRMHFNRVDVDNFFRQPSQRDRQLQASPRPIANVAATQVDVQRIQNLYQQRVTADTTVETQGVSSSTVTEHTQ